MSDSTTSHTIRSQPPDVIVAVGSGDAMQEFECYKVVLAHAAEYFDVMLSAGMEEDVKSRITFPDKDPETWREFYKLIDPSQVGRAEKESVTMENVCLLMPWFHEFHMAEYLERSCSVILRFLEESPRVLGGNGKSRKILFWNKNADGDQSRLERRKSIFLRMIEVLEVSIACNMFRPAEAADEFIFALLEKIHYTIDLFRPEVVKRLVPFMVAPTESDESPLRQPASLLRSYFDDLLLPQVTDNPNNEWNVSEEFIERNDGNCLSPDLASEKAFPLLVHAYLQKQASEASVYHSLGYDKCQKIAEKFPGFTDTL